MLKIPTKFANNVNELSYVNKYVGIETERINRLKVVLVEQNCTGKWLAGQLGKNEATVSRWCSNNPQPSLEILVKIASILKVDPRQLINGGNID